MVASEQRTRVRVEVSAGKADVPIRAGVEVGSNQNLQLRWELCETHGLVYGKSVESFDEAIYKCWCCGRAWSSSGTRECSARASLPLRLQRCPRVKKQSDRCVIEEIVFNRVRTRFVRLFEDR